MIFISNLILFLPGLKTSKVKHGPSNTSKKKIKTFRENQDRETQEYLENKKRLQDRFSLLISEANKEGKSTIDFLTERGSPYKKAKIISMMAKQYGLRADADRIWIQNIRGKILNG